MSLLLIIGCGRSGTTVLCKSLNEHSKIKIVNGENPLLPWYGKILFQYNLAGNANYYQQNTRINSAQFNQEITSLALRCIWGDENPEDETGDVIYNGVKSFPAEDSFAGLLKGFPSLKAIYVYRNGLDVVNSMCYFPSFTSLPFKEKCKFWAARVLQYNYLRTHSNSYTVRFEDFLSDPANVLSEVQRFLGIDHETSPALFAENNLVHPLQEKTRKDNPLKVLSARRPGYHDWSIEERNAFIDICGEGMKILDYIIPFEKA